MKKLNERCPLQNECGRVCKFEKKENQCGYYQANSRPGYELDDQEPSETVDVFERLESSEIPGSLVYIDVSKIYPHPQNPRNDLGDLTELAESIKAQGILQNLTIVKRDPGYCISCKLWNGGIGKCTEDHDKEGRPPCQKWVSDGSYTVIIGHRRLAAAKLAGLKEVPCAITDMSPQDQIATMLLENMQRSDLTVYEQAQGIQMMLDLGESVANISEKTGFSETTVRRRVKLLELDQEKFKAASQRGVTLMDFAELEKIENLELRNRVLEKIGTSNFRFELQRAIDKETSEKNMVVLLAELKKFATQIESNNSGLRYVCSYSASQKPTVTIPDDAETVKYFFVVSQYYYITLYKEWSNSTYTPLIDEKEQARREKRAALDEISKRAYQLRSDFIRDISNAKAKKSMSVIIEYPLRVMLGDCYGKDYQDLAEYLGIEVNDIAEQVVAQPERCMLVATYLSLDSEHQYYYDWSNQYKENEDLDTVYDFLEKLGYEMSDEEKSMRDGTHELFKDSED